LVDGGDFDRINDEDYPATVSSFRLDTYEVTVARFRKFEAEFAANWRPTVGEGNNPDDETDMGWQSSFTAALPADRTALRSMLACHYHATWTNDPAGNEERPINCVDWYTAFAFCIWDEGRLPTEAEWNFAAAGGDEQRVYPWSNPASSALIEVRHASFNSLGELECGGDYTVGCAVTDLVEVGTRVDGYGFFGHAELGGNVYEWTRDRYEPTLPTPCVDCANLSEGPRHVVRGACYFNIEILLRTDFRLDGWVNEEPSSGIGLRCARDRGP
jgi:formylglycine-generating enzyme required for sulfatase activity